MTGLVTAAAPPEWAPLMVMSAPNGARRMPSDHPALPISIEDTALTAAACKEAGACAIHLHVRDADGKHLLDSDAYKAATAAVRQHVGDDMIVQITTEAVGIYEPEHQMAVVREVKPEAVSVAMREIIPDDTHEATAAEFYAWAVRENIQVQHIVYEPDDLKRFIERHRRGIVPGESAFLLLVIGRYSPDQTSGPADLLPYFEVDDLRGYHWGFCGFGPREAASAMTCTALGGHVRIGFENNFHLPDGSVAEDNAALVRTVAAGAATLSRPLATADQARAFLAAPPPLREAA